MDTKLQEEKFRSNLVQIRREKNLSQESLAANSELDRTFISMIERGVRTPTLKSILKIAMALKVNPSDLFSGVSNE